MEVQISVLWILGVTILSATPLKPTETDLNSLFPWVENALHLEYLLWEMYLINGHAGYYEMTSRSSDCCWLLQKWGEIPSQKGKWNKWGETPSQKGKRNVQDEISLDFLPQVGFSQIAFRWRQLHKVNFLPDLKLAWWRELLITDEMQIPG